ncbi:MAG: PLP-dependent aminotransferase family protein [Candidatus Eisenbacteria bacterium]|nr:PLP-dependent aminotransferase family protein [Candidatus Eisenbacteria bacterium]
MRDPLTPNPSAGPPLAAWTDRIERSALEEMLVETARPEVLSLALGLPTAELFPREAMGRAVAELIAHDPRALQYGPPRDDLRRFVVELMRERGVECRIEQVFLTAGAQQGMSLLARLLLEPGASVLLEEQCYTGFQQVLAPHAARIVPVGSDPSSGIDLAQLEARLGAADLPALLYTMSDGSNPTGASLPLAARPRLVELARKHQIPILEDDAYGLLSYDGTRIPALRAFDPDWVIYLGSFSKTLAPALRTGWVIVPERFTAALGSLKESSDINTATLGQRAIARFVAEGGFHPHLAKLRAAYRERRDALLDALSTHLPEGATWTTPRAGFFVWVALPGEIDTVALLRRALREEHVAFVPGGAFAVPGAQPARSALRLNFSFSPPAVLREAVSRLARAIAREGRA